MLRKKLPANAKDSDGQWYAALGDYAGTAAPAWPINTIVHKALSTGDEFLEFDMDTQSDKSLEVHWLCIFNADLYQACCYEWRCPAWQFLTFGNSIDHGDTRKVAVRAIQCSQVEPLMHCAARYGFWDLNKTALTSLATYQGLECEASEDVFSLCLQIVMSVFNISEAKAVEKLQRRLVLLHARDTVTIETFLQIDEGLELLDQDDQKAARKEQDKLRGKKKEAADFAATFKQQRAQHKGKAQPGKSSASKANAKHKDNDKRAPVPAGAITQHEAKQMLPPGPNCISTCVRVVSHLMSSPQCTP